MRDVKLQIQPDYSETFRVGMSKEICMTNEQREIHRKKRVLEHAVRMGNVNKTCRYFGVARSTFYLWRARYRELGDEGLKSRRHNRTRYLNSPGAAAFLCPNLRGSRTSLPDWDKACLPAC
jgi:hypothetical protein